MYDDWPAMLLGLRTLSFAGAACWTAIPRTSLADRAFYLLLHILSLCFALVFFFIQYIYHWSFSLNTDCWVYLTLQHTVMQSVGGWFLGLLALLVRRSCMDGCVFSEGTPTAWVCSGRSWRGWCTRRSPSVLCLCSLSFLPPGSISLQFFVRHFQLFCLAWL